MTMKNDEPENETSEAVAEYKRILAGVLDQRPSGTRQRLAAALAKNRSFISQISNPAYPTPIPANHIDVIFEICHFSPAEKKHFMDVYRRGHPKRFAVRHDAQHLKPHTIYLPDFGSDARNEQLHAIVGDFVRQIVRVMKEPEKKAQPK